MKGLLTAAAARHRSGTSITFPTSGQSLDLFNGVAGGITSSVWAAITSGFVGLNKDGTGQGVCGTPATATTFVYFATGTFGPDTDAAVTVSAPAAEAPMLELGVRVTNQGTSNHSGYYVSIDGTTNIWSLTVRINGVVTTLATGVVQVVNAGDLVGINITGTKLSAWYRPGTKGKMTQVLSYDTVNDATKYSGAGYIALRIKNTKIRYPQGGTCVPGGKAVDSLIWCLDFARPPATSTAPPSAGWYVPYPLPQSKNYGTSDTTHAAFGDALIESAQPLSGSFSGNMTVYGTHGALNAPLERVNLESNPPSYNPALYIDGTLLDQQGKLIGWGWYQTMRFGFDNLAWTNSPIIAQPHWNNPQPPCVGIKLVDANTLGVMLNAGIYDPSKSPIFEYHSDPTVTNSNLPQMAIRPSSAGAMALFPSYHEIILYLQHMDHNGVQAGNTAIIQAWYRPQGGNWSLNVDTTQWAQNFGTLVSDTTGAMYDQNYLIHMANFYRDVVLGQQNSIWIAKSSLHGTLSSAMAYMDI